ncbi:hypothetical protein ABPG75_005570 [Micractinium tetrahymenae]
MALFRRLLRSTDEFIERARRGPFGESSRLLFQFKSPEDLAQWSTFSDAELGGKSTAQLALAEDPQGTAVLYGTFSTEVGEGAHARLRRSGFAGMTNRPLVDAGRLDLEDFDSLVFRVRGDGRQYIASIRCENWLVDQRSHDVWQAFLFARKGEWSEVEIPLSRFLLTWKGKVVEEVVEVNAKRITSLGISLAGGDNLQKDGEYQLGLEWIAARNSRLHEYEQLQQQEQAGRGGGSTSSGSSSGDEGGSSSSASSGTAAKGWWETK